MPPAEELPDPSSGAPQEAVARAFGAENRSRLLDRYFEQAERVTAANAWQHVYRLLLWIDRTTALAHCYESDKAQPGRPWYARSLAFHDWVSTELGVSPAALAEEIDWLFREAVKDLAARAVAARRNAAYERQRAPYAGRDFPEPGEDPELAAIILESAGQDFGYVLITNEFDAARLRAACEKRRQNALLFTHVVHINPAAVEMVYNEATSEGAEALRAHIAKGRLMSLHAWLEAAGVR
jgi:hypothetical protein